MTGSQQYNKVKEEAPPVKSPMEESVDALAGVEGALTGKRKPSPPAATGSKKKAKKAQARDRSTSIEGLVEAAATLQDVAPPDLPPPVEGEVPNPMLPPAASTKGEAAVDEPNPTGFRKSRAKKKKSNSITAASGSTTKAKDTKSTSTTITTDDDNKRTQIQYNPDIPMTKEQLTSWRREMRRVRNRESAAASRRKVRDKIEELEDEVSKWKTLYEDVVSRLGEAEQQQLGIGLEEQAFEAPPIENGHVKLPHPPAAESKTVHVDDMVREGGELLPGNKAEI